MSDSTNDAKVVNQDSNRPANDSTTAGSNVKDGKPHNQQKVKKKTDVAAEDVGQGS